MSETTTQREKQYYVCPECGRTALLLYDEPEPATLLGCNDGHKSKDMHKL